MEEIKIKYLRRLGGAIIEGNLQTHKCRFGIQPNNFIKRIKEIKWNKIINKLI